MSLRSFVSALLVILGGLLVGSAVPVMWERSVLTDGDRFVAAAQPLADDPGVQDAVATVVVGQLNSRLAQLDVPATALPPALRRLAPQAGVALQRYVRQVVQAYVRTPAFRDLWPTMVRSAHDSLVRTLTDGPYRPVTVDVSAVVAQVRAQLIKAGLPQALAKALPDTDVRITVSRVGALATARDSLRLLDPASIFLPVAAGVVLLLGLALARRRVRALAGAAVCAAGGLGLVLLLVWLARSYVVEHLVPALLPASSRAAVYDAVTGDLRSWVVVSLVGCGAVLAVAVVLLALGRARRLAS